jgi:apolipoprotein N-acyltransferase
VIGNDDARKEPEKNPRDDYRVDYNAVMLFERGNLTKLYRKMHLVPFTEHFPYEKQFPWIYQALKNADTHFWEKGSEATVFSLPAFSFSSPICFEDTFGYLSREFVRNGAEIIVNLTNDAWSKSLPAQNQHLSMAVFRAVENRRSMARSTASGQTCAVDPNGRVIAMAPPFTESWITAELPIMKTTTLYTRWGDFSAWIFVIAAGALLILGFISHILRTVKKKPSAD